MVIDLMAAPEATGIFTRERLERMNFESAEIAYKHLGVEAMRCGFTIATNQSKRSNCMTIHCGKGGRVRGNDTKKTGCPFRVYLTPGEDGRAVIRHLRSSAIFIHIQLGICVGQPFWGPQRVPDVRDTPTARRPVAGWEIGRYIYRDWIVWFP